jgi:hypothetical protein
VSSRSSAAASRPAQTGPPAQPGRPLRQPPPGEAWPSQFAQALAETLAGSRPPGQVRPWTTEQARRRIRHLGPLMQAGPRPTVRRVLASEPEPGVLELAIIVSLGSRLRALAVRLEHPDRRPGSGSAADAPPWICTAIEAA